MPRMSSTFRAEAVPAIGQSNAAHENVTLEFKVSQFLNMAGGEQGCNLGKGRHFIFSVQTPARSPAHSASTRVPWLCITSK